MSREIPKNVWNYNAYDKEDKSENYPSFFSFEFGDKISNIQFQLRPLVANLQFLPRLIKVALRLAFNCFSYSRNFAERNVWKSVRMLTSHQLGSLMVHSLECKS